VAVVIAGKGPRTKVVAGIVFLTVILVVGAYGSVGRETPGLIGDPPF
jgi:hypothetical protein